MQSPFPSLDQRSAPCACRRRSACRRAARGTPRRGVDTTPARVSLPGADHLSPPDSQSPDHWSDAAVNATAPLPGSWHDRDTAASPITHPARAASRPSAVLRAMTAGKPQALTPSLMSVPRRWRQPNALEDRRLRMHKPPGQAAARRRRRGRTVRTGRRGRCRSGS